MVRLTPRPVRPARRAPSGLCPRLPVAEAVEPRVLLATFTVTTTANTGAGSLRQAIIDANATVAPDTIVFDASFYAAPRTISLTTPVTQIGQPLTIVGPGSQMLTVTRTVDGPPVNRHVFSSFASSLTMSGMTVTGGNVAGAAGGGLSVNGISPNVTLDDMVFTNNTAGVDNDGGAISLNNNATLTLRNSVVTGNSARNGGGIFFFDGGSLVMENTTVSRNTAFAGDTGLGGGGLFFSGPARTQPPPGFESSTLVVRNSTFSGNTSGRAGGGILAHNLVGSLLVQNSTVSGNTAGTSGGGIDLGGANGFGSVAVQNSTVTANTASGTAPATGGGGVSRTATRPGGLLVHNSIVSGNTNGNAPDLLASAGFTTTEVRSSAVGSPAGFAPSGASGNNLPYGVDLRLGPLADNGGPTRTHLPHPLSPLVDAGNNDLVPAGSSYDQRGFGFFRINNLRVDVGSVELPAPPGVTRVYLDGPGPGTNSAFAAASGYVAPFGYPVPDGAAQSRPLPWIQGVRSVAIAFVPPVGELLQQDDLQVFGATGPIPVVGFTYNTPTRIGVWTLGGSAVTQDRLRLVLDDAVVPGLDGEWADGADAYPSGDGAAGGDFVFRVNVLSGDVTGDAVVNASDVAEIKRRLTRRPGDGVTDPLRAYSIFADVNADGQINATDLAQVKARLTRRLPPVSGVSARRREAGQGVTGRK